MMRWRAGESIRVFDVYTRDVFKHWKWIRVLLAGE